MRAIQKKIMKRWNRFLNGEIDIDLRPIGQFAKAKKIEKLKMDMKQYHLFLELVSKVNQYLEKMLGSNIY